MSLFNLSKKYKTEYISLIVFLTYITTI